MRKLLSNTENPVRDFNRQIDLGDPACVERMQAPCEGLSETVGVPQAQKHPPAPPLEQWASSYEDRNQKIVAAHATGEYSYQQLADF